MTGLCENCNKDKDLYTTWEGRLLCDDCYKETDQEP